MRRSRALEGLLRDAPDYLAAARVHDIMLCVPTFGRVKVAKILGVCRISTGKTFAGLSPCQRDELATRLRR